ncbi:MAG TPA: NADH-quinone oxidoreductase subunit J [Paludibacter sp.]|nr:NADH-quinone oxidoreductase subunit J [Paludibacter sp.]
MAQQIIFFVLAAIIAVFSILAVTSKRIIRSATYLLFVLLATSGLYLLLEYNYLFAVQVAVYAGGIMVLFIFVILLTNKPGEKVNTELPARRVIAGLTVLAGLAFCAHIIYWNVKKITEVVAQSDITPQTLGHAMLGTAKYQYLLPFETISILLLACIIGAIMVARKR